MFAFIALKMSKMNWAFMRSLSAKDLSSRKSTMVTFGERASLMGASQEVTVTRPSYTVFRWVGA